MNRDDLLKLFPTLKPEVQNVLWHGFTNSVIVINDKQEWVRNKDYGIPIRKRPNNIR